MLSPSLTKKKVSNIKAKCKLKNRKKMELLVNIPSIYTKWLFKSSKIYAKKINIKL